MELYKKENINPFGSIGFLFIQLPVLLVVYRIILGIQTPSNFYYLYSPQETFNLSSVNFEFF
jgi:membrane protein insertase Oxa1/YidC/SpoIIIJ